VTEIAGTSIGLANFYFENKERLFEATLQHLCRRGAGRVAKAER
jgi:AcrR family transcriptional regulator